MPPDARRYFHAGLVAAGFVATISPPARALDKQGAAHKGGGPGAPAGDAGAFRLQVSGQLFFGVLPYNPTYAARPDNTGHALLRAGGHADIDLFGERLFIPIDVNMFSDRDQPSGRPSEIDVIGGVASTWGVPGGKTELGVRGEWDATADGRATGRSSQGYVDVRARYMSSVAALAGGKAPSPLAPLLGGGDLSGWLTLGWFAWNPVYYARPDNTGRALLRYVAHVEVSFWRERLAWFVDGTFFTDRTVHALRPSELDLTVGMSFTAGDWGAMIAYERDMPTDGRGSGLVQHMVMVQGSWSFAWHR